MGRLLDKLGASIGFFLSLTRNRPLRNALLAYLLFSAVEYGTWVAFLVYAYEATGPASVGIVALILLIPAALFAPAAAAIGDRIPRGRFLLLSYATQTLAMATVAVAMLLGAVPLMVYAFACLASASVTMTRPAQGAVLPALAERADELTAANGLMAVFEGAGVLLGPLCAAAILAFASPGGVVAAGAMALGGATLLAATVRTPRPPTLPDEEESAPSWFEGVRLIARDREPRLLIVLLASRWILLGALDVLFVLMALELFDTGRSGPGVLTAALGAGGMIGGAATVALVGRRSLGPLLVLGALVFGIPIILIGMFPSPTSAIVLLAAGAVGLSLMDATGRTLLQRVVDDDVLARVFGVLEGLSMAALGLGSILVPVLVAWLGLQGSIVAFGALLPALALLGIRGLRRIDAHAVVPERALRLLSHVAMFAPLRPETLEWIARKSTWVHAPEGGVVIAEGDAGDLYYVLSSGAVDVTRSGTWLHTFSEPGDGFGEIALLYDVPRTATVMAVEDTELLAIDRRDFLTAVTGHAEVAGAAERVARERMPGS